MKKKAILTTVVCAVLLLLVVAAGLNAIFTVTLVRTEFTTYSEEGRAEAEDLRKRLDGFVGKSSAFLDLGEISGIVAEYPFFKLESLEKRYPTTVYVRVSERRETFAVARADGDYDLYAENGVFLRTSASADNRAGGQNVLLEGFSLGAEGTPAMLTGEYAQSLLGAAEAFSEELSEIRANVLSVTLVKNTSNARNDYFRIRMHEGVVVDLANPAAMAKEKAALALARYAALSDEARSFGYITVVDGEDGTLLSDYSRNSLLG